MSKSKCNNCNEYFDRDEMIKTMGSRYCTWDCVQETQQERYEKAAVRRLNSKRQPMDPKLRRDVLRRDRERCRGCRKTRASLMFDLHVHHVIYRSEQGEDSMENLLTLCVDCHNMVHSNKRTFQPACLALLVHLNSMKFSNAIISDFEC